MDGLYVQTDTYPMAETGCEVMVIGRSHGSSSAKAVLSIEALDPNSLVEIRSGRSPNTDSFSLLTQIFFEFRGHRESVELPIGGDTLDHITVMRVLRGRVSATVVAPHQVQMCFRTRKHP